MKTVMRNTGRSRAPRSRQSARCEASSIAGASGSCHVVRCSEAAFLSWQKAMMPTHNPHTGRCRKEAALRVMKHHLA